MKSFAFALTACLTSAALAVAPHACAEPSALVVRDVVMLKNGGMVRGTIRELVPDDYVVIDMQGGEARRFAMSEVRYAGTAEGAPGQTAPKEAPAPTATPVEPPKDTAKVAARNPPEAEALPEPTRRGVVRIHIDAEDPQVQLHRYQGTAGYWAGKTFVSTELSSLICRAPCDEVVDGSKGEEFFFGGKGMPPSSHFQLFDRRGDVSAEVKAGSNTGRVAGIGLGVGGVLLATTGVLAVLLSREDSTSVEVTGGGGVPIARPRDESNSGRTLGYVMIGGGALALVGGIWLWLANQTTYELDRSAPAKSGSASRQRPASWAFGTF